MLGLGLKLLGIGKFLREFFVANWKWLLPLLAAAALIWYAWSWHNNAVEQAYANGVQYEHNQWLKKVDDENANNRQLEASLSNTLTEVVQREIEKKNVRVEQETVHTNTLETIIRQDVKYVDCQIDPEAQAEINKIRELGPQ